MKNVMVYYDESTEMTQEKWDGWVIAMERAAWNLARGDAIAILYRLEREINETGGSRQRGEGVPMLGRMRKYLQEWVK